MAALRECYLPHVIIALLVLYLLWRIGHELEEIAHRILPPQVIHSTL
ncbi:MAG: hypothetical protein M0Z55_05430 [Peptococcaceae bacterium]|nr:hypothetical protein [Peptococcaceae bacterium]